MKKCSCGKPPVVGGFGISWAVFCSCGNNTVGVGHSRFSAKRMWNRSRKHQIRMEGK